MKKLQFLERDYKCPASGECIYYAKMYLKRYSSVDKSLINDMTIHYQYRLTENEKEKQALIALLFDRQNALVTYSMYTQGSDSDFLHFLEMAGRNEITNIVYIDCAGTIKKLS